MIWLAWTHPAWAGDAVDLAGWSTTALEARPDLAGDTDVRFRQQLGLSAALPKGWRVEGDGAIRHPAEGDDVVLDLHRLVVVAGRGRGARLTAGRTVKTDLRGFLPIDGLVLEGELAAAVRGEVWAGRLWSPESLDVDTSWTGGAGIVVRPPGEHGMPSRRSTLTASWMGTASGDHVTHSLAAAAATGGPRGGSATADVEVRAGASDDVHARAGAQATVLAGKSVRLSPEVRWEGLAPAGQVVALRSPVEWLAGAGYALAGGGATFGDDTFGLEVRGGGVVHPDPDEEASEGGLGRIGLGWRSSQGPRLGVFGLGAAVGASWVAGGGVEAGFTSEALRLACDAGLFQFRPIADTVTPIAEVRLRGGTGFSGDRGERLGVSVELSAGSDRLLRRWMQGGLVVEGAVGGGRNAP